MEAELDEKRGQAALGAGTLGGTRQEL